jgi:hypothetical protein
MSDLTRESLSGVLAARGVPRDAYCLSGGLPNESYCIDHQGAQWLVYYSERGCKTGLREFATESEACDYLLSLLERLT